MRSAVAFFIFMLVIMVHAPRALAIVTGLEDARALSVSCDKAAKAEPEDINGFKEKACIARAAPCDVKDAGVLLFHANIDVVCKVTGTTCPALDVCATEKLTGKFAEAVRMKLDPNNAPSTDGAADPTDRKSERVRR